ncbi:MAG: protein-disulfide reductase DsbD family protein, partial [Phycisphaerales bacterium]|nr:protein-disulfide reductase DsbD family protein [Phycisphaerales bacterium]
DTGSFYSALDAESNAKEGESYLWTPEQMRSVLEAAGLSDEVAFAMEVYGLDLGVNFEDPHHPGEMNNVIFLPEKPDETAQRLGLTMRELETKFTLINTALRAARDQRDQPGLDQKVIAGWNGLMIGGMADGGRVLKNPSYVAAADAAADDLMSAMWSSNTGLTRTRRDGAGKIPAFLEDYAYMIRGLLRLERASGNSMRLDQAAALAKQAKERFWDEQSGGWYETRAGQDDLLVRGRSFYDGAMPSANAVMINNMIELYRRTGKKSYGEDAVAGLNSVSADIKEAPRGVVHSVQALHRIDSKHPELLGTAVAGAKKAPGAHVAFSADVRQVRLGVGESATVTLTLIIDEGWHVNANQQMDEYTLPLEILSLSDGLHVQPQYPAGHPFTSPDGQVNVYEGTVQIPITLTRTGPIGRSGRMTVTWQSCNDRTCLMPKTEAVPIKVLPPRGS